MYTMTLQQIVESGYNIGLQTYPCFNENYRVALNNKIENNYYFSQIAFETPARFIYELNNKMCLIMPKYNDMLMTYRELRNISFDDMIHISIGNNFTKTTQGTAEHTNQQTTDDTTTDNRTTITTNTKTYNSDNNTTYNETTTTNYNSDTTNEQLTDSININLGADTPMSQIDTDLTVETEWRNSPLVSNGSLDKNNQGKTKIENRGNDATSHTGTNNGHHGGTDTENINTTDNNVNNYDGLQNTNYDGAYSDTETYSNYNFDYMATYEKIMKTIQNIDELIINELKDLFLTIY